MHFHFLQRTTHGAENKNPCVGAVMQSVRLDHSLQPTDTGTVIKSTAISTNHARLFFISWQLDWSAAELLVTKLTSWTPSN